ncbi:hypothetical protein Tco_1075696 [Tanacetum coccineum]
MYCNEPNDEYYEMAINQFDSSELLRNESLINARIGKEAQCGCELTNVSDPSELDHRICLLRVLTHKANCFVAKGDMKSAQWHNCWPFCVHCLPTLIPMGAPSAYVDVILHSHALNLDDVDLEEFVIKYFRALPSHTILGMTILKDKHMGMLEILLGESFMPFKYGAHMMMSRFKSNGEPLVVLMPVEPINLFDSLEDCLSLFRGLSLLAWKKYLDERVGDLCDTAVIGLRSASSVNESGNGGNGGVNEHENLGHSNVLKNTAVNKDDVAKVNLTSGNDGDLVMLSSMDGLDAMLQNRSSYARVMIELRVDVELKDTIMLVMPKLPRRGFIRVLFELSMIGNHPSVRVKNNVNTGGNKKKDVECTKEVSNPNPFDVLKSVENDVDLGLNEETSNVASNEANSSGYWF